MKRFLSIITRELKLFKSNKVMIILFFGAPVLLGIVYGLIYQSGKLNNLPIMVIDKDHSPASVSLIDMLEDNDVLTVKYVNAENIDIREKFITDGIYGAVLIPKNFENDLLQRRYTEVSTYINNTNMFASGYVNRAIGAVVGTLNAVTSAKTGKPEPIRLNVFRLFNRSSNYFMYIWPSFLAIFMQAVMLVVVAMSFSYEAEKGTLKELKTFRLPAISIMIGKVCLYWFLSAIVICIYRLYFYFFRQSLPEHLPDAILITGLFVLALSFQGMIAGLIIKSQLKTIQFLMILNMPAWTASGFSWPYDQDGLPAQIYGILFPYMPFINGFRVLLIEHGTLNDIRGYINLQIIQLLLYSLIAWLLMKYKLNRQAIVCQQIPA